MCLQWASFPWVTEGPAAVCDVTEGQQEGSGCRWTGPFCRCREKHCVQAQPVHMRARTRTHSHRVTGAVHTCPAASAAQELSPQRWVSSCSKQLLGLMSKRRFGHHARCYTKNADNNVEHELSPRNAWRAWKRPPRCPLPTRGPITCDLPWPMESCQCDWTGGA